MNHAGYLIAAIALLFGAPNGIPAAQAETIQLKADLKGANEIPPNASPASGKALARPDKTSAAATVGRNFIAGIRRHRPLSSIPRAGIYPGSSSAVPLITAH